jgi:hypothetical protein
MALSQRRRQSYPLCLWPDLVGNSILSNRCHVPQIGQSVAIGQSVQNGKTLGMRVLPIDAAIVTRARVTRANPTFAPYHTYPLQFCKNGLTLPTSLLHTAHPRRHFIGTKPLPGVRMRVSGSTGILLHAAACRWSRSSPKP